MTNRGNKARGPNITVVGSVNMDLVVGVPRHPAPGETLIGSDYVTHPGGKGANQAVAAARLGANVRFVGRIGADSFGQDLRNSMAADAVDVSYLRTSKGPSGVAFIQVDERGQNSIVVSPGANFDVSTADLVSAAFEDCSTLVLQLEVPLEVVTAAARKARQHGAAVILNLAPAQRLDRGQLQNVTHLVVNEYEAGLLLGIPSFSVSADPEGSARRLTDLVPNVVITLGDKGAAWATCDDNGLNTGSMPAFKVKVVDTTAAGDTFTAAFALAIAKGAEAEAGGYGAAGSIEEAVRFASAAGALTTTKPGAQPSLPRLDEVLKLLKAGRA